MSNFNTVVEKIQELSYEEQDQLNFLLKKYLIEFRRDEIYDNYKKSLKRKNQKFTGNIKELKEKLET